MKYATNKMWPKEKTDNLDQEKKVFIHKREEVKEDLKIDNQYENNDIMKDSSFV